MGGKTMVTVSAGELPQWSYVRAECVTRSGEDVSLESNGAAPASCLDEIALSDSDPALAEGSVESGHRLLRRVERRAYSNPFWIQKVP